MFKDERTKATRIYTTEFRGLVLLVLVKFNAQISTASVCMVEILCPVKKLTTITRYCNKSDYPCRSDGRFDMDVTHACNFVLNVTCVYGRTGRVNHISKKKNAKSENGRLAQVGWRELHVWKEGTHAFMVTTF
jgi:hypothetical protein